jgi:formate/nitrite transporter FocA (FNT family)
MSGIYIVTLETKEPPQMSAYTATFSNGKIITRKTMRPYAAAYAVEIVGTVYTGWTTGFSRTREMAEREVTTIRNRCAKRGTQILFAEVVDTVDTLI